MDPSYIHQKYVMLTAIVDPKLYNNIVKDGAFRFVWLTPTYTRVENVQKRLQCEAAVYTLMYMMRAVVHIHMEHVTIKGGIHQSRSDDVQHLTLVWKNNGKKFMVVHLPYDEGAEYFKIYEARMFLACRRRRRGGIPFAEFIRIDFD